MWNGHSVCKSGKIDLTGTNALVLLRLWAVLPLSRCAGKWAQRLWNSKIQLNCWSLHRSLTVHTCYWTAKIQNCPSGVTIVFDPIGRDLQSIINIRPLDNKSMTSLSMQLISNVQHTAHLNVWIIILSVSETSVMKKRLFNTNVFKSSTNTERIC